MSEQRQIMRNSQIMMAVTSVSRVFGLIRDQVIAYLLGTSRWADVWNLAFMLPNMFRRLIAEGAMSSAFIPIFSELSEKEQEQEAQQFVRAVFSLILVAVTVLISVIVLFLPILLPALLGLTRVAAATGDDDITTMAMLPTRLMFPYLLFVSLAAICQGVLNVQNRFALAAATPIVLNFCIIVFALLMKDRFGSPIWGVCIGVLIGGFLQFFMQWLHLARLGFRITTTLQFWNRRTAEAVRLWVPSVFSAGVSQFNALISTLIATNLLVGAATAISFSNRLMELILGVFAVAVSTSLLPVLSRQRSRGDLPAMTESLYDALEVMAFICIPASMGLILAGPSVIAVLFERGMFDRNSTELTYLALIFHAMAILPICWYRITIQAFYAFKQVKVTVIVAVIGATLNIACCYLFPNLLYFSHAGVALATLVSSWLLYGMLRWQVGRRNALHWPKKCNRELLKIAVATVAFVPVWLPFTPQILSLIGLLLRIGASVAIYAGLSRIMKVQALARLIHRN